MIVRTTADVINRMWNWKMQSAYEYAKTIPDFPNSAFKILKESAETYGNCGWQEGELFNKLRENNDRVASILGYEWSDEKDYWFKNPEK